MDKPVQLSMFDGVETDWGKQEDRPRKGRWYIVTRNWSKEALYLIDGKWCWCEYDPLISVPHAVTSHMEAKRLRLQHSGHDIRIWPYGVLRPGRTK